MVFLLLSVAHTVQLGRICCCVVMDCSTWSNVWSSGSLHSCWWFALWILNFISVYSSFSVLSFTGLAYLNHLMAGMAYCCGRNAAPAEISKKTILELTLGSRFHPVSIWCLREPSGALRFYWINSNKGDKRNAWESNCLLVLRFAGCLSISFMFWNFLTLLLTISSWSLSKGTDFSFWLC